MENYNSSFRCPVFFGFHLHVTQALGELRHYPMQFREGSCSHDAARKTIRYAEDHMPASFVSDGSAVLEKLVEGERAFGLLALKALALRLFQKLLEIVYPTAHAGHSARPNSSFSL
jgi:hypothetical protein